MRYLIGGLFGVTLCFAFFAIMSYLEYEAPQYVLPTPHTPTHDRVPALKEAVNVTPDKVNSLKTPSLYTKEPLLLEENKNQLYKWKDSNGNWAFGNKVPYGKPYQLVDLPKEGLSVVKLAPIPRSRRSSNHKAKPKQRMQSRPQRYNSQAIEKQKLVASNHTHCRWVVGRAAELRNKILANTSSRPSIWCKEYKKRLSEMRKLASEDHRCNYSYRLPSTCAR